MFHCSDCFDLNLFWDALQKFDWLPEGMEPLADGEYDAIIMGTGLKECVISGLLSVKGMKVLHVDRNGYYGADCASLNLTNLYEKFKAGEPPSFLGANRDYNVDLIPKFIMANGADPRVVSPPLAPVTVLRP